MTAIFNCCSRRGDTGSAAIEPRPEQTRSRHPDWLRCRDRVLSGSASAERRVVAARHHAWRLDRLASIDRAGQPDELGVAPDEWRCRERVLARCERRVAAIRWTAVVPHLLGEEERAVVGRASHRVEEPLGVAPASEDILTTLAGQQRPTAAKG